MGRKEYTEQDQLDFIETAKEMGIGPAMRSLGYPHSHHTAHKWFVSRNLDLPSVNSLMQEAANLGAFYKDRDLQIAAQKVLDRIVEAAMSDPNLTPEEINKLANALHKAIQTINLIQGKSTSIESKTIKDGTDLALTELLNEAKARNAANEANIVDRTDN